LAKRGKEKKAPGQYGPDGNPQLASGRVYIKSVQAKRK
jgi:hypothetical protein